MVKERYISGRETERDRTGMKGKALRMEKRKNKKGRKGWTRQRRRRRKRR